MGNEETVTYAELFEGVKLFAAAFRKNGLKTGDRVACMYKQFLKNIALALFYEVILANGVKSYLFFMLYF